MAASDMGDEDFWLPISCVAFEERVSLMQPERAETARLKAMSAKMRVYFMAGIFI